MKPTLPRTAINRFLSFFASARPVVKTKPTQPTAEHSEQLNATEKHAHTKHDNVPLSPEEHLKLVNTIREAAENPPFNYYS